MIIKRKLYLCYNEVKYVCKIKNHEYTIAFNPQWIEINLVDFSTFLFLNSSIDLDVIELNDFNEFVKDSRQIDYVEYVV